MDSREFLEIVARGEDAFTEFKREDAHPDDLAATLVAFANSEGGKLFLGVTDNGVIEGVKSPDLAMQRLDSIACQNCDPPLPIFIEKVTINGVVALVAHVPKGAERPYRTNRGVYWIRGNAGRRQASREELLRLYQASRSLFYDELPVPGTTLEDLSVGAFEAMFRDVYGQKPSETGLPLERLLWQLRLMAGERETRPGTALEPAAATNLSVAGVLLFGENPQAWLPYAKISAVRFAGREVGEEIIDRKEIEGTLFEQIEDAERFAYIHIAIPGTIKGFVRHDSPEIPLEALREAIVNAVAHRDYSIRSQVRIFIFEDRVEVHSPGRLPNTVTLDNIRYGIHVERNPILVSFLTKKGFMGQIGTGILRIIRLLRAIGQEPGFALHDHEFVVTLPKRKD